MDNILSTDRSSLSCNIGHQNYSASRPKFRPLRIKALLDSCASDDDESEDKPRDSEDDSDCEDPQPLPDDADDELIFDEPHHHISPSSSSNKGSNAAITTNHTHSSDQHKAEDIEGDNSRNNLESINFKESLTIHSVIHENVNKMEEPKQSVSSKTGSTNFHKQSLSDKQQHAPISYTVDYNINAVKNISVGLTNSRLLPSDSKNKGNQDDFYDKNMDDRGQRYVKSNTILSTFNDNHIHVNKMDAKYQQDFHKPSNSESMVHNNRNDESVPSVQNKQQTNSLLESLDSAYNTKDKRVHSQNPMICETPSDHTQSSQASHLVTDTPLKHTSMNMTRPNPCLSHRNIFQTPQNKLENLSKSHAQTPATIFSHWSQNNMGQTPLQNKVLHTKNNVQTPTQSIFTSAASRHETPRFFGMDCKSVRRPLVDTTYGSQRIATTSNSVLQSELKTHYSHSQQLPKVQEIPNNNHFDQYPKKIADNINMQNKDIIECTEKKSIQSNINSHEDAKENDQPNVLEKSGNNEQSQLDTILKSKHVVIGSNINVNTNDVLQACNKDNGNKQFEHKELSNHCPTPSSRKLHNDVPDGNRISLENSHNAADQKKSQLEVRQVMDKMSAIQCSIPSNISKQKRKTTVFVKNKEYLVLGTLGQGMSGEVLRVQDLSTSELRAIKCVNLSCMEKDAAQGCLEEISMLHKLQAPCVVRMFDYEVKPPMVYVVMEMGDTDLSRLLKSMAQEKQLPLTMILYYWTEMLTAVKHIHDNGVIHSDLKPANFLLVRGRLKLIDFGIASSMNPDATSVVKNCPIGTLNYISPEALMDIGGNGDTTSDVKYKITFKSDVWSLGCILYSLVYGHTPFQHIRSQWAKINAITNPKPNISFPTDSSSSNGRNISGFPPPILVDVMRKCLQHDPKARPTVTQLLQIQYVPTNKVTTSLTPDIPGHILVKIKNSLSEDDWRLFIRALEDGRHT